jgi:hypothetical protein
LQELRELALFATKVEHVAECALGAGDGGGEGGEAARRTALERPQKRASLGSSGAFPASNRRQLHHPFGLLVHPVRQHGRVVALAVVRPALRDHGEAERIQVFRAPPGGR